MIFLNFFEYLDKDCAKSKEAFLYSIKKLPSSKIIVINVGLSSLTYDTGFYNIRNLKNFIADVSELINSDSKKRVVIVVSDSIKNIKQQYFALQGTQKIKKTRTVINAEDSVQPIDSIQEVLNTDSSLYSALVSMVNSDIVNLFYDGFSNYNLRAIGFSVSSNGVDIVGGLKKVLKSIESIAFQTSIKDDEKIAAIKKYLSSSKNITQTTSFKAVTQKTTETIKGLFKVYPRTIPIIMEDISQKINSLDDDGFAARIAIAINADVMISISRKGMLYTVDPLKNDKALPFYCYDTSRSAPAPFKEAGRKESLSKKLTAAKNMNEHKRSIPMLLAPYNSPNTIYNMFDSDKINDICVNGELPFFTILINSTDISLPIENRLIAGTIFIDKNAAVALMNKSSLLSVGITSVEGDFDRKATVAILDEKLVEIGRGVTDFSSKELQQKLESHTSVTVINRGKLRINENYSRGEV